MRKAHLLRTGDMIYYHDHTMVHKTRIGKITSVERNSVDFIVIFMDDYWNPQNKISITAMGDDLIEMYYPVTRHT